MQFILILYSSCIDDMCYLHHSSYTHSLNVDFCCVENHQYMWLMQKQCHQTPLQLLIYPKEFRMDSMPSLWQRLSFFICHSLSNSFLIGHYACGILLFDELVLFSPPLPLSKYASKLLLCFFVCFFISVCWMSTNCHSPCYLKQEQLQEQAQL